MNKEEVLEAINFLKKYKTENSEIETKSAKLGFPKKCYDTISAFANQYGGIILFGINEENNFEIEGVYDLNDLQKQITNLCSDSFEPRIRPEIIQLEIDGKNILAVKIKELEQTKKPCYYKPKGIKGGSYIRIGDRDDLMTDYELYSLQSYKEHIFDDIRPTKRATLDDLDRDELVEYIDKVKKDKPNFAKYDFDKCLNLCGITDKNQEQVYPTLAGVMLFGKYPQCFYPQLFVACVVVPGTELGMKGEHGERFIDNKRIEGTIEEMLDGTMNFFRRNMRTSVTIDSNGKRTDRTEYPIDALREAVANSLIHRDFSYLSETSYISVYMYSDRVEIISPGGLYGVNKLEKIEVSNNYESRNPTILKILEEKSNVIENRHTGIPTMRDEMKKHGLPEPEFYIERNCFKVVFRNKPIVVTQNNQISEQVGEQVGEQVSEQVSEQVNGLHEKVINFCNTPKSLDEIKNYLNIKSRSYISRKIINPLIKEGILSYTNINSPNASNQKYIAIKKN